MTDEEIQSMAFEIAAVGKDGLDYAPSDQKYTLRSPPGECFSGLQAMCLMYAGFAGTGSDQDVGMNLNEPFEEALRLY